eukprot:gb/GEZN01024416.1/.p1 GENE.gb/GEZN01024416.1/~~gb/GEZN01024416.1/.p1  ORF type:complete len:160 (-),score=12.83 gb/GEZN01024416.1/:22-501(-)
MTDQVPQCVTCSLAISTDADDCMFCGGRFHTACLAEPRDDKLCTDCKSITKGKEDPRMVSACEELMEWLEVESNADLLHQDLRICIPTAVMKSLDYYAAKGAKLMKLRCNHATKLLKKLETSKIIMHESAEDFQASYKKAADDLKKALVCASRVIEHCS